MLRISSSSPLLVYGLRSPPDGRGRRQRRLACVVQEEARVSLWCELSGSNKRERELAHKVMWYLNGAFLHSSANSDVYNLTLAHSQEERRGQLGSISCAHHVLGASSSTDSFQASQMRVHQSANELLLRAKGELRASWARWRQCGAPSGQLIKANILNFKLHKTTQ